ncbi:MAG: hypothetical protein IKF70_03325 [Firmicutes bacterium]|nr:hypothetical protein [Bacillota bacterium]
MLGKLLKYEMKSTSRFMWIIYGAVIVVGIIAGILLRLDIALGSAGYEDGVISAQTADTIQMILTFITFSIYFLLLIAMEVLTMVMIVMRFWKNMFGSEGYLMHTLPVPSWMLVTSKLIIAVLWELMAAVTALISGSFILGISGLLREIFGGVSIREFLDSFTEIGLRLEPGKWIFIIIFAALAGILQFYFAMSLGNMANKNKILYSVLSFLGINIAVSIVSGIIQFARMMIMQNALSTGAVFSILGWPTLILYAVLAIGFFFGTYMIMENKLNLE